MSGSLYSKYKGRNAENVDTRISVNIINISTRIKRIRNKRYGIITCDPYCRVDGDSLNLKYHQDTVYT